MARKMTQARVARKLGITQDSVSRLEQRSDLMLSTLQKTVEALGGRLQLVAEFSDFPPVVLSGIGEQGARTRARAKTALRRRKRKGG